MMMSVENDIEVDPAWVLSQQPTTTLEEIFEDEIPTVDNVKYMISSNEKVICVAGETGHSQVWKYFGKIYNDEKLLDPKHVYCEPCLARKQVKRYKIGTSTGNLREHLIGCHEIEIKSAYTKTAPHQKKSSPFPIINLNATKVDKEKENEFKLACQMCLWIARDIKQFDIISKPGFQDFCRWAGVIKYEEKVPDIMKVSRCALNDLYEWVHSKVHSLLISTPNGMSVSLDSWTDRYRQLMYITYALHWIDEDWELRSVGLRTSFFPLPHTAEEITENIKAVLSEFGLESKDIMVICDSTPNIIQACKDIHIKQLTCTAHRLNLLINGLLAHEKMDSLRSVMKKMKAIHRTLIYRYDGLRTDNVLSNNQKILDLVESHCRIEDIFEAEDKVESFDDFETGSADHGYAMRADSGQNKSSARPLRTSLHWQSVIMLMRSLLRNHDIVKWILEQLQKYDQILTDTELTRAEDFLKVMDVIELTTDILCGSKYTTMNYSLLFKSELIDKLKNDVIDGAFVKQMMDIVLSNLESQFPVTEEAVLATLLDPSMQNLGIIKEYLEGKGVTKIDFLRAKAKEYLGTQVQGIDQKPSITSPVDISKEPKVKKLRMALLKKHAAEPNDGFEQELLKYHITSEAISDPMTWWKDNQNCYPRLSSLARIFLCIPATSAPTESAFSAERVVVNAKRASIDPTRVNKLLFIHDNYELTI